MFTALKKKNAKLLFQNARDCIPGKNKGFAWEYNSRL